MAFAEAMHRRLALAFNIIFCVALFAIVFQPVTGNAQDRIAHVIGNGRYKAVPVLSNAGNDARGMSAILRQLGFDVTQGTDLDRAGMDRSVSEFMTNAASCAWRLCFTPDTAFRCTAGIICCR